MDYDICQKIQKSVYPTDAFWDHEKRGFRTQEMNPLMSELFSLSMSYENEWAQKKDKSEDLSYLVAGRGLEPLTSGL